MTGRISAQVVHRRRSSGRPETNTGIAASARIVTLTNSSQTGHPARSRCQPASRRWISGPVMRAARRTWTSRVAAVTPTSRSPHREHDRRQARDRDDEHHRQAPLRLAERSAVEPGAPAPAPARDANVGRVAARAATSPSTTPPAPASGQQHGSPASTSRSLARSPARPPRTPRGGTARARATAPSRSAPASRPASRTSTSGHRRHGGEPASAALSTPSHVNASGDTSRRTGHRTMPSSRRVYQGLSAHRPRSAPRPSRGRPPIRRGGVHPQASCGATSRATRSRWSRSARSRTWRYARRRTHLRDRPEPVDGLGHGPGDARSRSSAGVRPIAAARRASSASSRPTASTERDREGDRRGSRPTSSHAARTLGEQRRQLRRSPGTRRCTPSRSGQRAPESDADPCRRR